MARAVEHVAVEFVALVRRRHPRADEVVLQHCHPAARDLALERFLGHVIERNFFVFVFGRVDRAAGVTRHHVEHAAAGGVTALELVV